MILYPTLELMNKKPVSLFRGRMDEPAIWHVDPVETARDWVSDGAEWVHVTDFDAINGADTNVDLIVEIIRTVGAPVQLGGGFRSAEAVAHWIDLGAARIVLSTLSVQSPDTVRALARRYPDQIVLSLDVMDGRLLVDGWRDTSAILPEALLAAYADAPLAGVVITDIDSDLDATEAQMGLISALAQNARAPVTASGVVRQADDIARLKYIPGVDGALIGRALFSKAINLSDALEIARPEPEAVAEFI